MKKETISKVEDIEKQINSLQSEIFEKQRELDQLIIDEGANFVGTFVEYFNGGEYVFIKVDKQQTIDHDGPKLLLAGQAVVLDDTPLVGKDNDDEVEMPDISSGTFDYWYSVEINPMVLDETSYARVRKISKDDFQFVLEYWFEQMKKTFKL